MAVDKRGEVAGTEGWHDMDNRHVERVGADRMVEGTKIKEGR